MKVLVKHTSVESVVSINRPIYTHAQRKVFVVITEEKTVLKIFLETTNRTSFLSWWGYGEMMLALKKSYKLSGW